MCGIQFCLTWRRITKKARCEHTGARLCVTAVLLCLLLLHRFSEISPLFLLQFYLFLNGRVLNPVSLAQSVDWRAQRNDPTADSQRPIAEHLLDRLNILADPVSHSE